MRHRCSRRAITRLVLSPCDGPAPPSGRLACRERLAPALRIVRRVAEWPGLVPIARAPRTRNAPPEDREERLRWDRVSGTRRSAERPRRRMLSTVASLRQAGSPDPWRPWPSWEQPSSWGSGLLRRGLAAFLGVSFFAALFFTLAFLGAGASPELFFAMTSNPLPEEKT